MSKLQIKQVGILSYAKILGVIGFVIGLLSGFLYLVIAIIGALSAGGRGTGGILLYGFIALIALPIIYTIVCFIGGAIGAFVYNFVAGYVGGIEIEVENIY